MINLNNRMGTIAKITETHPGLGKTAMMKFIFLLQMVYKVPLGYNFEIYTYGPYSSEVMEDIDLAKHQNIISLETVAYPSGHSGYNLNPSTNIEAILSEEDEFISNYKDDIEQVINLFGNKTAKELELLTTIVYLYQTYNKNNWTSNLEEISNNVHEIKPYFDISEIRKRYLYLDDLGFLSKTIE